MSKNRKTVGEWYETRWGPAFPPWTRYQSVRALGWLVAILIVAALGLGYGYVVAREGLEETWLEPGRKPRQTPVEIELISTDELFAQALEIATKHEQDALLDRLSLQRGSSNRSLTYEVSFRFCSPRDPSWMLTVQAKPRWKLFGGGVRFIENLYISDLPAKGDVCSSRALEYPAVDNVQALETMQGVVEERYAAQWPDRVYLRRTPKGTLVWEGYYTIYDTHRGRIEVVVDGHSGEVLGVSYLDW